MSAQVVEKMVARDGIEPSTRGFSGRAPFMSHPPDPVGLFIGNLLLITNYFATFGSDLSCFLPVIRNRFRVGGVGFGLGDRA